jgi:phosphonate transport system substrate-binding protein
MRWTSTKISAPSLILFFILLALAGSASAEIRLGILPRLGAVELFVMFNPLAEYLAIETGEKVSIVIPRDFDAYKAAVRAGNFDLGFTNSLIYVQLKKDVQIEPLAIASEQKAGTRFRGIIIARKNSGIVSLPDLKGKRLVFVERDSAAGYLFQMLLLKKAGLEVNRDFILLPFAKRHDNVVMAVFNGAADAGGMREDDFERMKDKVDISQLKIIGYTEYFPNWTMFASPGLNKATADKIRTALLNLKSGNPQSKKVLKPARLTGFAQATDRDYDRLRQAAREVGAL